MTGYVGLGQDFGHVKKPTTAAMAIRAACSGILNKRTHTHPKGGYRLPKGRAIG